MSYQSLAVKYRPKRFQDMVGQSAITKALANAIRLARIPQGLIFAGVRGIGKTTTARLYAKALNCESGPTEDPCNTCASCEAINQGRHEDVLEVDGASNTSVDDIRALQETLDYVPQRSPYKIYIIDEVHMLSQSAFNALLKTLEEPPEHVVFVFATTELQKLPETVLSRCQTFHLKRLSLATIVGRLGDILKLEGVDFEEHALASIAKEGRGSMRDSLTFLDQVIALGDGSVSSRSLEGLVNTASSGTYIEFLGALVERSANKILDLIAHWDEQGISLEDAVEESAKFSRHGFVLRELGQDALDVTLLGLAPSEAERLYEVANSAESLDLNRIFRTLVKCRKDLNGGDLDRFILENYSLEWCLDPGLPSLDELSSIASGGGVSQKSKAGSTQAGAVAKQQPSSGAKSGAANLKQRWAKTFGSQESHSAEAQEAAEQNRSSARDIDVASPAANSHFGISRESVPVSDASTLKPSLTQRDFKSQAVVKDSDESITTEVKESLAQEKPQVGQAMVEAEAGVPLPESWRALVEVWKEQKPLQGRVLEETVPISYSPTLIKVAVDPASMAGAKLLHADHRKRVLDGIREVFGFLGRLEVVERADQQETPRATTPQAEVVVKEVVSNEAETNRCQNNQNDAPKESLLELRQKEEEKARQELFNELKQHPITEEALSIFDGKIDNISMSDY